MKQKFFLSLIAMTLTVLTASAQDEQKLTVSAGNVHYLNIESNMNVVLMPAFPGDKTFSMDNAASTLLNVALSGSTMTIAPADVSKNKKTTVYVLVDDIKTITLASNSEIKTVGILKARHIDVYVDGGSTAHLRTSGKVQPHSLSSGDIDVKDLSGNWLAKR